MLGLGEQPVVLGWGWTGLGGNRGLGDGSGGDGGDGRAVARWGACVPPLGRLGEEAMVVGLGAG